jgi:hypothetical protein
VPLSGADTFKVQCPCPSEQHKLLIPPQVFRLTKQALRAETVERTERAAETQDRAALEVWSAAETHAQVREYLRRTIRK